MHTVGDIAQPDAKCAPGSKVHWLLGDACVVCTDTRQHVWRGMRLAAASMQ